MGTDPVRTLKKWRLARGYSTRQLAQIAGLTKGTIVASKLGVPEAGHRHGSGSPMRWESSPNRSPSTGDSWS
jgi:transcriptional regulator with XRE-family HTH domain